jgi:hypothetical protein
MEDQMKTFREWNFEVARFGDCSIEEGILLFCLNSYNDVGRLLMMPTLLGSVMSLDLLVILFFSSKIYSILIIF